MSVGMSVCVRKCVSAIVGMNACSCVSLTD